MTVGIDDLQTWHRPAPDALRGLVGGLNGYDERTSGPLTRRELPHPGVVFILEIGEPIEVGDAGAEAGERHAGSFVAGIYEGVAVCRHGGAQSGIEVNLTPRGARRLLGLPLHALTNRSVSVRDLLPAHHRDLPARLAATDVWSARLRMVEAVLLERLREPVAQERMVDWAVGRIVASGGRVDVGGLVRALGYSHTHVGRLFRDHVGLPPKRLARLVRFDALRRRLAAEREVDWASWAIELGFSDQAHLAREVRRFTGRTPTALRAASWRQVDSVQDPGSGAA